MGAGVGRETAGLGHNEKKIPGDADVTNNTVGESQWPMTVSAWPKSIPLTDSKQLVRCSQCKGTKWNRGAGTFLGQKILFIGGPVASLYCTVLLK